MTRREWTTGPKQRDNINPFCYIEDVIPSRFALGESPLTFLTQHLNLTLPSISPT